MQLQLVIMPQATFLGLFFCPETGNSVREGHVYPRTWGQVFRELTWRHPEVRGDAQGACPSSQQDGLVAGLQNDGHTQVHTPTGGQLGSRRPGLLVQGRERAERRPLVGGSR